MELGVYIELSRNCRKSSLRSRQAILQNNLLVLRPQLHQVVVKHKVLNVSKNKIAMQ
jgi:hypothetical protein